MNFKRILALLLAALMIFSICACKKDDETPADTSAKETQQKETQKKDPETDPSTDAPETDEPDVDAQFINPLTGLESSVDLSKRRPISVMINNIGASLPQSGISSADIIFECLAEGGITRLMMISTEYEKLPKVGSVRSARDYYIDYAESFNCIFIHAGGSPIAYDTLANRGNAHIDGVNGPSPEGTFARDQDRLNAGVASEHTLFLQGGEAIKNAIETLGYNKDKAEGYETPMVFMPLEETAKFDNLATHIGVPVSSYQYVDYVYDAETGEYLRYQYNGDKHMDSATDTQLSFTNVILMYNDSGRISGDEKNRIWMQTTGKGDAYYITNGSYVHIYWEKEAHDSVIKYYYPDGTEVQFNRGKTMINVIDNSNMDKLVFDDKTDKFEK
ncbi:MAG: DUF3048 domain-containing protein [Clostridia bacterium]|nr:DUF3048 domain-containing protein [Clostridia bacterium]